MITVKVNPQSLARFGQKMRDFAFVTKQTASDCCKEQAALICADMAVFTPPLVPGGGGGLSKSAEIAGKGAVSGDIRKMFIAVGDKNIKTQTALVTRNLAAATKNDNLALFNQVVAQSPVNVLRGLSPVMRKILNDTDYTRAFAKAKNYLHRVPSQSNVYGLDYEQDLRGKHNAVKGKFGGRIKKGQRIGTPRMLVQSKDVLDTYIKDRQQEVGFIKSGWLSALRKIPPPMINGIPKNFGSKLANAPDFIQRHNNPSGYVQITTGANGFRIVIGNQRGNVNMIADEAGTLNLVLANREKQMTRRIERFLAIAARKANAGPNK